MTIKFPDRRRFQSHILSSCRVLSIFVALTAMAALTSMMGCASKGDSAVGAAQQDLVTTSDEPDIRRRARIRLELAVGYFEQGQTTVALDELKQSIATDPGFADAYNLRGLIYMRLSDVRLAEDSFRRALVISPNDPNVLHNYGWMLCQQNRYAESQQALAQAIANPLYGAPAKSWMAQGLCQVRAGQIAQGELSLQHSYELDPANPVTGYNLALLLYQRGDFGRSQFYVRRLNNSDLANAESLWLGIKVERRLENREAMLQLAGQLRKRFAQSAQLAAFDRSAFDE
jgi:type IV pilus assembly protein PilF